MSNPLLVERSGAITRLRFNRPERLNAIDAAMAAAFREAVDALPQDPDLRCVVLCGAGRAFMAGGDIAAFQGPQALAEIRRILKPMHEGVAGLAALPVPVLASVQGAAAGGGFSLALGADLMIAAEDARFALGYLKLGTVPDCGGSWVLPRLLGLRGAMGLAMLGEELDGRAALAAGLVNRIVPAAELEAATEALAQQLASGPTAAFGRAKALLRASPGRDLPTQLHAEEEAFLASAGTADFAEGVGAFLGRRRAEFSGK
ncbi:enoyl-CoA hydratase/isomerase family protein [Belnapia sp. T6]|uniref:Enoyl-CoA hydratase/isomerase family protein n=1 Tax=Belnapia mucosa TaxID=2804532 RepID=A0ABS1UZW0_9PROT|nr:enoyl-CoA hydratase-related protein [Belnapia mucosa]MBL6454991.1 enoyl-CoA hydratase/isomerase family protein [Belnapia mucosa]